MKAIASLFAVLALTAMLATSAAADDMADCKSDNPSRAVAACQRLLKGGKLAPHVRATVHALLSRAYLRSNQLDQAAAEASRAIAADPRAGGGYFARALVSSERGEVDKALADLDKAISIDPKLSAAYHSRGQIYIRKQDYERAVRDLSRAIELDPWHYQFFHDRGLAYMRARVLERALTDLNNAISLKPDSHVSLGLRGLVHAMKGETDKAIADLSRAIELSPRTASFYSERGSIYTYLGDHQRALADLARAIELDPRQASAFASRARVNADRGDIEGALADAEKAIELQPRSAVGYKVRGIAYEKKGDAEKALASLTRAIELDPRDPEAFSLRADILLKQDNKAQATADLRQLLSLPARRQRERDAQIRAAQTLTLLTRPPALAQPGPAQASPPAPENPSPPPSGSPRTPGGQPAPVVTPRAPEGAPALPSGPAKPATDRRIALVIGNSTYAFAGTLKNPPHDARTVAKVLRLIGFTDVAEHYDVGLAPMTAALKTFGDRAAGADWAVIYYAGHGIELGGIPYLVPTDAKLEQDTHVADEAIPLERMLQKTESAKKLRLIILDACRNNPFIAKMARGVGSTRAIGRGLPAIEPEGDVLVAYATRHGTTALDGDGENSPFATALVRHMVEPNIDVRVMFGKVRDTVRAATNGQQDPQIYGSIGGDLRYFASNQ